MTQRISDDRDLPKRPNHGKRDDDTLVNFQEEINKPTEESLMKAIHAVEPEKDIEQEEDDVLGNLDLSKVPTPKPSKYAKYKKITKVKSESENTSDLTEAAALERKINVSAVPVIPEESKESVKIDYSKKSLIQSEKSLVKESVRTLESTNTSRLDVVRSKIQGSIGSTTVSTFLLPNEELQKVTAPEVQLADAESRAMTPSRSAVSTGPIHERGNYLINLAPQPIDEYGADDDDEEVSNPN